jgi:hypothetical protein
MFSSHVVKDLSGYCNGETSDERSRQIAEHLIACHRCRSEFEEIKLGAKLAARLPQITAPDSLWLDLQSRLDREYRTTKPAAQKRSLFSRQSWRPAFAGIATGLMVIVILAAVWIRSIESRQFWRVARLDGAPMIGTRPVDQNGRLAVGEWLETDSASRAQIDVGSIGEVEIDRNTRVRLVQTEATEHRLELAQGKLSANIWAPPRLFFVDTPSGVAADLGCAYTLEVDDKGRGLLHVTSGRVALQLKDRESLVPAGATCATRPGVGPGTPYFNDASETFRSALSSLDFDPGAGAAESSALELLLKEARTRDSLTLWHLLPRVDGEARGSVYDRLAALAPPPSGVTREGIVRLDEHMLEAWKAKLQPAWHNESAIRKFVGVWIRALGRVRGLIKQR